MHVSDAAKSLFFNEKYNNVIQSMGIGRDLSIKQLARKFQK